jgi:hypothetical protein
MNTRPWLRFSLVLALGTAACASPGRSPSERSSLGKPARQTSPTVHVSNHNFADVTVYVVQSGMRSRLGMVTGLTSRRFALPRGVSLAGGDIRILARPVGDSQTYLSPPVRVSPGQALDLNLGAILNLSSLSVW